MTAVGSPADKPEYVVLPLPGFQTLAAKMQKRLIKNNLLLTNVAGTGHYGNQTLFPLQIHWTAVLLCSELLLCCTPDTAAFHKAGKVIPVFLYDFFSSPIIDLVFEIM